MASEACSLQIVFTPSGPGTRLASLTITDNAANSAPPVTLVGSTQAEPLKALPVNSESFAQSITAGQTANFKLQLSATFDGTVTFACSGAPESATCSFSPSAIPVTSIQPASFSVNVATVAASSPTPLLSKRNDPQISPNKFLPLVFSLFCALLIRIFRTSPALIAQTSPTRHLALHPFSISANAAVVALLLFSVVTFAGCGGASTVATAPAVTPTPTSTSQTYTITITPSATTSDKTAIPALQPIQLTLILD